MKANRESIALAMQIIIGKLSHHQIAKITDKVLDCQKETLNGNANSQLIAQKALDDLISTFANNMLECDAKGIANVLTDTIFFE